MPILSYSQSHPEIAESAYIDSMATVIGKTIIGPDSSVWPMAVIRGDMLSIEIGARTSIQDGCILHITHMSQYNPKGAPLKIGDDVTVGHGAKLHGCTIEHHCLIGIDSIILDNAHLEPNTMVAAGSLVPPGKTLESGYLYVGSPVIKKRPLSSEEIEFIHYSAQNYVKLKEVYLNKAANPYEQI